MVGKFDFKLDKFPLVYDLTLHLFVLGIFANDANAAFTAHGFAFVAHFFDRCLHLHIF